jgi:uncharacterized integral membrane protein
MQILLIFALVIAFIAILFASQNTDIISISFLRWETEGSLALILFIALVAGALISYLATTPGQIRRRMTISSQQKTIVELESQLNNAQDELTTIQEKLAHIEEEKQTQETSPAETGSSSPAADEKET